MISLCAVLLGLSLAVEKLIAFKACWANPGRQNQEEWLQVHQGRDWTVLQTNIMCTGCIKCLGVLYDLDYSGTSQYEASRRMLIMIMKVLAKKRASPETVEAVITTSLLNKAAYQGVLFNWNPAQTLLLDDKAV